MLHTWRLPCRAQRGSHRRGTNVRPLSDQTSRGCSCNRSVSAGAVAAGRKMMRTNLETKKEDLSRGCWLHIAATVCRNCCNVTSEARCASTTAPLQRPRHTNWSKVTPRRRTVSLSTQHCMRCENAFARNRAHHPHLQLRLAEPPPHALPLPTRINAESV